MTDTKLPQATAKGRATVENTNSMVFGKKGFGKTTFNEEVYTAKKVRLIVVDPRQEYTNGKIFTDYNEFIDELVKNMQGQFRYICRMPGREPEIFKLFACDKNTGKALLQNTTMLVEEIDEWSDSYNIDPSLENHLAYGRHSRNNLIGISRYPFEIHRKLTRQADLIISFRQNEENDLAYFRKFDAKTADELPGLEVGEYRVCRGTKEELLKFIAEP